MAAKKTVNTEPVEEIKAEAIAEIADTEAVEAEKPKSAWEDMVQVMVPRKKKNEYFYVCVNDRRFYIPADGKMQTMPRPVAEILQQSIEAEYVAEDYAANIPNRTGFGQ